jgi:hypothetical protein
MSKLTRKEKLRRYHAIYNQIYTNPRVHVHEISKNVKMARNTVSGYLDHMYDSQILFGPELRLEYYPGLNKYFQLVKFDDPIIAFEELRNVSQIDYCSLFLGDWNIMYISDGKYDPSHIEGFEYLLFQGVRGDITTPRVPLSDWKPAFKRMKGEAHEFEPNGHEKMSLPIHEPPPWDEEEWKLFSEYEYDFRKKVTPALRKHLISSDKFYQWLESVFDHTTVLMRFYPDGYLNYTHFVFLLRTGYTDAVIALLSNLPTSTVCTHTEEGLLVWLSIKSDLTFTDLSATLQFMRSSNMIDKFNQAIGVLHYIEGEEEQSLLE